MLPQSKLVGISMALAAAIFWGVSGSCAQFLFEQKQINPAWLVCWRLLVSGSILLLLSLLKKNSDTFEVSKSPRDIIELLLFSVLGMVAVQYTYFYSINLSNAATATVLQYTGPIFVVGFYAIKNKKLPILSEYAALILALGGTFLLVTHGNIKQLVISDKALIWGVLSALSLAFYTIFPVRLLKKYSALTVTGWGMIIGGLVFSVINQPWSVSGIWDFETWAAFIYIIIFGTVIAFAIFLSALKIIGAQSASLLCSVEPISAAIVAVFWLKVSFQAIDWVGTGMILATVIILTKIKNR
jgi:drug/metabolite transporter (DMT)-like permease